MKRIEVQRTIPERVVKKELQIGESAYTSPSAFDVLPDHRIVFSRDYTLKAKIEWGSPEHVRVTLMPSGTMRIDEATWSVDDRWQLLGFEYVMPSVHMPAELAVWNGADYDIHDRLPVDMVFDKVFEFKEGETRYINLDNLRVDRDGHPYLYYLSSALTEKKYNCEAKVCMVGGELVISSKEFKGGLFMTDRVRDYTDEHHTAVYRPLKINVEGFLKKSEIVDTIPEKYLAR